MEQIHKKDEFVKQEEAIRAHFSKKAQLVFFAPLSNKTEASCRTIFEYEQDKNVSTDVLISRLAKIIAKGYSRYDLVDGYTTRSFRTAELNKMITEVTKEVGYCRDVDDAFHRRKESETKMLEDAVAEHFSTEENYVIFDVSADKIESLFTYVHGGEDISTTDLISSIREVLNDGYVACGLEGKEREKADAELDKLREEAHYAKC